MSGGEPDDKEVEKRRDAVLRRMLSTPPKPHDKPKDSKPSGQSPKGGLRERRRTDDSRNNGGD